MRYLLPLLLLLAACGSGPRPLIGEPKAEVLADVDIADVTHERTMEFGRGSVDMYENFGAFIDDKVAMGGEVNPPLKRWSPGLRGRTLVSFTTVAERTDEARAAGGRSTATIWYFWDEKDRLIATLREPWDR